MSTAATCIEKTAKEIKEKSVAVEGAKGATALGAFTLGSDYLFNRIGKAKKTAPKFFNKKSLKSAALWGAGTGLASMGATYIRNRAIRDTKESMNKTAEEKRKFDTGEALKAGLLYPLGAIGGLVRGSESGHKTSGFWLGPGGAAGAEAKNKKKSKLKEVMSGMAGAGALFGALQGGMKAAGSGRGRLAGALTGAAAGAVGGGVGGAATYGLGHYFGKDYSKDKDADKELRRLNRPGK